MYSLFLTVYPSIAHCLPSGPSFPPLSWASTSKLICCFPSQCSTINECFDTQEGTHQKDSRTNPQFMWGLKFSTILIFLLPKNSFSYPCPSPLKLSALPIFSPHFYILLWFSYPSCLPKKTGSPILWPHMWPSPSTNDVSGHLRASLKLTPETIVGAWPFPRVHAVQHEGE